MSTSKNQYPRYHTKQPVIYILLASYGTTTNARQAKGIIPKEKK